MQWMIRFYTQTQVKKLNVQNVENYLWLTTTMQDTRMKSTSTVLTVLTVTITSLATTSCTAFT